MNFSEIIKKHAHEFLVINALGMIWAVVIKRGFDIYSVSLMAALLGLNTAHTFIVGDSK